MRPVFAVGTVVLLVAACTGEASAPGDRESSSTTAESSTTVPSATTSTPAVPTAAPTPAAPTTTSTPSGSDDFDVVGGELRYHLDLEMTGCERMTTSTPVDATVAAEFVDPSRTIAESGGTTRLALSILACDDLRTDDRSHGPGHFATAWIPLAHESEPDLPAGSSIRSSGTDFYAPLLFQTDNVEFARATMDFGIPMMQATFEFEPTKSGIQHGSVEQAWTSPAVSYDWQIDNVDTRSIPDRIGVHTLLGTSNTPQLPLVLVGNFVHATSGFSGNVASVDIPSDSFLSPLLGDGFDAPGNGDAVDVEMVAMRFDPLDAFEPAIGTDTMAAGPDTRVRVESPSEPCGSQLRPAIVGPVGVSDELIALGNVVVHVQLVSDAPAALTPDKVADIARGADQLGMAVAWLRSRAAEYCIDPSSIAVSGYSWSGIAALSLAYATDEFEVGDPIEVDPLGVPAEMPDVVPLPVMPTLAEFSTTPNGAIGFASFAPPGTIDPGEPPSLLFNGTNDAAVPFELAEATRDEAASAGVDCELVVHTDGHAFVPSGVDVVAIVDEFLEQL